MPSFYSFLGSNSSSDASSVQSRCAENYPEKRMRGPLTGSSGLGSLETGLVSKELQLLTTQYVRFFINRSGNVVDRTEKFGGCYSIRFKLISIANPTCSTARDGRKRSCPNVVVGTMRYNWKVLQKFMFTAQSKADICSHVFFKSFEKSKS